MQNTSILMFTEIVTYTGTIKHGSFRNGGKTKGNKIPEFKQYIAPLVLELSIHSYTIDKATTPVYYLLVRSMEDYYYSACCLDRTNVTRFRYASRAI